KSRRRTNRNEGFFTQALNAALRYQQLRGAPDETATTSFDKLLRALPKNTAHPDHRASRATCAARLSKSMSAPAAGNGCGSRYQSSVNEAEPPGGMLLRVPCGSSSQAGICPAFGYQKQRVSPAISG